MTWTLVLQIIALMIGGVAATAAFCCVVAAFCIWYAKWEKGAS